MGPQFNPNQSYDVPAFDPSASYDLAAPSLGDVLTQRTEQTDKEYLGYTGAAGVAGATIHGLNEVARSTKDAIKGTLESFDPRPKDETERHVVGQLGGGPGILPVFRLLRSLGHSAADSLQLAGAVHDINQSPDPTGTYLKVAGDTASQGAGQAITALGTEGAIKGAGAVKVENPKALATAPIRGAARAAETAINQKLLPVKKIVNLMTPADEAEALNVKVPGRDFGLGKKPTPVYPGAPLPEHPGVFPGAPLPENPGQAIGLGQGPQRYTPPTEAGAELGRVKPPAAPDLEGVTSDQTAGAGETVEAEPEAVEPEAAPAATSQNANSAEPPKRTIVTDPKTGRPEFSDVLERQLTEALGGKPLEPRVPLRKQPMPAAPVSAPKVPEGFTPVTNSSVLRGYKYNAAAKELEAITNTGAHYVHGEVTPDDFTQFEATESKGKAWNALKDNHVYVAKVHNGVRQPVKGFAAIDAEQGNPNAGQIPKKQAGSRSIVVDSTSGKPEFSDVIEAKKAAPAPAAQPKQVVGTAEGTAADNRYFAQAKEELPNGSVSDWARRAQELKEDKPQITRTRTQRTIVKDPETGRPEFSDVVEAKQKPAAEASSEPAAAVGEDLSAQLAQSVDQAKKIGKGGVMTSAAPAELAKRWGVDPESLASGREQTRGMSAEQTEADIEKLADRYRKGQPVEPVMETRDADNNIVEVDGRARAIAAQRAGVERIPVMVRRINQAAGEAAEGASHEITEGAESAGSAGSVTGETVPGPRKPSAPTTAGEETSIRVPGEDRTYKGRYQVRELKDVQPSHSGINFNANEKYALVNDRDYSNPVNQGKVVTNSAPGKFDPSYHITDNPDATNGPVVVDSDGHALGGNGRTMILQRVYKYNTEGAAAYRQMLEKKAAQFGLDPAAIAKMKEPVLVRELADSELEGSGKQDAITDFNKTGTAAMTPAERAIADSRRVSADTLDDIAGRLEREGADATLADLLTGKNGTQVLDKLIEDGVLPHQERAGLATGDALTEAGRDRIRKLLVARFFKDPSQIDATPAAVRNKIESMAAPLARVEGVHGWDLTPHVQDAMSLVEEMRTHGIKNVDDLLGQRGFWGDARYSPEAVTLAKAINGASARTLQNAARRYVADMADAHRPLLAGQGISADQAFKEAFENPQPKGKNAAAERMSSGSDAPSLF